MQLCAVKKRKKKQLIEKAYETAIKKCKVGLYLL